MPLTIEEQQNYILKRCREDSAALGQFLFGNKPGPPHLMWFDAMNTYNRILIVAFPGSGKTYTVETQMLFDIGNNPHRTNLVASVTTGQANKRLSMIGETILYNPRFKAVFPWIEPDKTKPWTSSEFNVTDNRIEKHRFMAKKDNDGTSNTASLMAFGVGSSGLIGNRFSGRVVIDDPHDEKAAFSPTDRSRTIDWFSRTLSSRLLPTAEVVCISNRWHEMDLAGHIMANMKSYRVYETPARIGGKIDGKPTWPEVWGQQELKDKEFEIGSRMFRAMYLNDVHALSGSMFDIDWMQKPLPTFDMELDYVLISIDPAVTNTATSDFTAIAVIGKGVDNYYYILEMHNRKMYPRDWVPFINELARSVEEKWGRMDKIIVEKTGQQAYIIDNLQAETPLPIEGYNRSGNKTQKAEIMALRMNQGVVCADWEASWAGEFKTQLLGFPKAGEHDDMVDAAAQGFNYLSSSDNLIGASYLGMGKSKEEDSADKPLQTGYNVIQTLEGFSIRI